MKWIIYGISGTVSFIMLLFSIHFFISNQSHTKQPSHFNNNPDSGFRSSVDRASDSIAAEAIDELTDDKATAVEAFQDVPSRGRHNPDEQARSSDGTMFSGIQGAVKSPGYYNIAPGARVQHLIDLAGGLQEDADLSDINLAAWVLDGAVLYIPEKVRSQQDGNAFILRGSRNATAMNPAQYTRRGWRIYWHPEYHKKYLSVDTGNSNTMHGVAQSQSINDHQQSSLININTATTEELQQLPGIGPVMAGNIIDYRNNVPFQSIQDITQVSGIGEKRFEAIQNLITVGH